MRSFKIFFFCICFFSYCKEFETALFLRIAYNISCLYLKYAVSSIYNIGRCRNIIGFFLNKKINIGLREIVNCIMNYYMKKQIFTFSKASKKVLPPCGFFEPMVCFFFGLYDCPPKTLNPSGNVQQRLVFSPAFSLDLSLCVRRQNTSG